MRVLAVGDLHNNVRWFLNKVLPYAIEQNVSKIVQVGDFGVVWIPVASGYTLDRISKALCEAEIDLHFLPGNHENFDLLEKMAAEAEMFSPEGHAQLRPRLFYTGKVSSWTWGSTRIAAVGGATSVDRESRVPGESWWPQEALTDAEQAEAEAIGRVSVLFAHDCPVEHPFQLKDNVDSAVHRRRMTAIGRALQPELWVHGHYHARASYGFRTEAGWGQVLGLGMDGTSLAENVQLLTLV